MGQKMELKVSLLVRMASYRTELYCRLVQCRMESKRRRLSP